MMTSMRMRGQTVSIVAVVASLVAAAALYLVLPSVHGSPYAGWSVAVADEIAIVGSNGSTRSAQPVTVFQRTSDQWVAVAALEPAKSQHLAAFGTAVAANEHVIVVGEPQRKSGLAFDGGAAYLFVETGGGWTLVDALGAGDGRPGNEFGWSLALDGDTLVVGARGEGAVYVFALHDASWEQTARLLPPGGASGTFFGNSVAISGDLIAAGEHWAAGGGSVWLFRREGDAWAEAGQLRSPKAHPDELFGFSIAIAADTLVVGAPGLLQDDINAGRPTPSSDPQVDGRSRTVWTLAMGARETALGTRSPRTAA